MSTYAASTLSADSKRQIARVGGGVLVAVAAASVARSLGRHWILGAAAGAALHQIVEPHLTSVLLESLG